MNTKKIVSGVELESLTTEVKDILPDLGDGFVQVTYMYYSTFISINCMLYNSKLFIG